MAARGFAGLQRRSPPSALSACSHVVGCEIDHAPVPAYEVLEAGFVEHGAYGGHVEAAPARRVGSGVARVDAGFCADGAASRNEADGIRPVNGYPGVVAYGYHGQGVHGGDQAEAQVDYLPVRIGEGSARNGDALHDAGVLAALLDSFEQMVRQFLSGVLGSDGLEAILDAQVRFDGGIDGLLTTLGGDGGELALAEADNVVGVIESASFRRLK